MARESGTGIAWLTGATFALGFLAAVMLSGAASGVGASPPGVSVSSARDALVAEAVKGELTRKVSELYYRYAGQVARTAAPADKVADDFWKWFDASPTIREGILAGVDCAYAGYVINRLAELRCEFGDGVDRYPQLAIAFALVYGRAADESIRLSIHGKPRDAGGRPVPSMVESFRYYTDHTEEMLFPLRKTPWPLLAHVADNDVPIIEREWVLTKYRGRSAESLCRLHSDPDYVKKTGVSSVSRKEGTPVTLSMIYEYGGVCLQLSSYATGVLKSLGVPSFRLVGRGHAWEGLVLPGKPYTMRFPANLGRPSGRLNCPLTRTQIRQHEVAMLAAAMSESFTGYLAARIAAAAYAMVPEKGRGQASELLWAALSRNHHCTEVWRRLAQARADGILSDAKAGMVYPTALRTLADHPRTTCEIFRTLVLPKLRATEDVDQRSFARLVRTIEHEARRYERMERLELGVLLRNELGNYVVATRGPSAVCDLYYSWLDASDSRGKDWSIGLVKHLTKLTRGEKRLPYRASLCLKVAVVTHW